MKKDESFEATRLRHLQRWVNAPAAIYKTSSFSEYEPWARAQEKLHDGGGSGLEQMQLAFA